jgi:hypothetical protein
MCNEKFVGFLSHLAEALAENFRISLEKNGGCTTKEELL